MFRGDASTHNGRHGDVSKNVTEVSAVGNTCSVFQYLDMQKEKQQSLWYMQWILYTQAQILDGSANNYTGTSTFGENSISRVVFVALYRNMAVLSAHRVGCQKYYVEV